MGLLCRPIAHVPPLLPLLIYQAQAHLQGGAPPRPLTCFGCICKFRSTNGAMNRYVPVGKAQLKFFHRPLSSLVQTGRAERKTKEQEQEQGGEERRRERRGGARETVCVERQAGAREQRRKGCAEKAEREDKKKNNVCQMSSTVKFLMTMRIYGLVD